MLHHSHRSLVDSQAQPLREDRVPPVTHGIARRSSTGGLARLAFLVGLIYCLGPQLATRAADTADLVIFNAKLFIPGETNVDALAIRGDRIVAVGNHQALAPWIGSTTRRLDARGASVTPGLNDAHVHFLSGCRALTQVDLSELEALADIERAIKSFAAAHPQQAWIQGRGWQYGSFVGGLPHKDLLDRWIADRPVVMRCYDGHSVWLNSRALQAAGINRATADPVGGVIVRDAVSGEPTGVLKESAQALLDGIVPEPSREEQLAMLRVGIAQAHKYGITSVQDAGVGLKECDLFETLRQQGELQLRVRLALEVRAGFIDSDLAQLDQLKRRFARLDIGAVKLFADGVIEAHTAALLAPYSNRPTRGLPESTPEALDRLVAQLDSQGWQIMVHAIGDGGIRMTLDAIEHAIQSNPKPERGRRHRLEHIESVSLEDVERFGRLGVIASMQPYHANPNSNLFQVWAANLGPERASRAWIWKSIQSAGGRLAFGSDWPVVSLDPRLGFHTALTRQTLDEQPPNGFLPDQRLSLTETLMNYTAGSAYAEFAEASKGKLEVGALADVVIWSHDLFALPSERVRTAEVVTTVLGGQVVFQR